MSYSVYFTYVAAASIMVAGSGQCWRETHDHLQTSVVIIVLNFEGKETRSYNLIEYVLFAHVLVYF